MQQRRSTFDLEGSGFSTRAELASWLEFVAWVDDPGANPDAYSWVGGVGWTPTTQVAVASAGAHRLPPTRPGRGKLHEAPAWAGDALAGLPAMLTTDEAVGVLRTSRRNLYRWISAGKLRAVRSGAGGSSRVLIPRTSIAEYLSRLD